MPELFYKPHIETRFFAFMASLLATAPFRDFEMIDLSKQVASETGFVDQVFSLPPFISDANQGVKCNPECWHHLNTQFVEANNKLGVMSGDPSWNL